MSGQDEDILKEFISYCETTNDNEWGTKVVRNKANTKNCMFGHLFNFGSNKGGEKLANVYWDFFEGSIATTYMVYRVNDGQHTGYQQTTPKERCIAYLKNLENGSEKTVIKQMEEDCLNYDKRGNPIRRVT